MIVALSCFSTSDSLISDLLGIHTHIDITNEEEDAPMDWTLNEVVHSRVSEAEVLRQWCESARGADCLSNLSFDSTLRKHTTKRLPYKAH